MAVGEQIVTTLLFRFLLPLTLLAAFVVRFNGLSLLYGLLLLVAPLIPTPFPHSRYAQSRHAVRYLISTAVLCSLTLLGQIIFHVFLLVKSKQGEPSHVLLPNCSAKESILRQVGFQQIESNNIPNIMRAIMPDVGCFIVSGIVLAACWKLWSPPAPRPGSQEEDTTPLQQSPTMQSIKRSRSAAVYYLGLVLLVFFLGFAGIAHPSALSALYFLAFLALAIYWACGQTVGVRFNTVRILLLLYSGCHLLLLHLYQFQFFQQGVSPQSLAARIVGLTGLIRTDCTQPWILYFHDNTRWPMFLSPGVILVLYHILAYEIRGFYDQAGGESDESRSLLWPWGRHSQPGTERQYLVESTGRRKRSYEAMGKTDAEQPAQDVADGGLDDTGSVIIDTEPHEPEQEESHTRHALMTVYLFLRKQSYVLCLIMMMVWSITYHSWLTFVYLLAACIIWMIPNSRLLCMRLSPFILLYAIMLLVSGYVYSLDWKQGEIQTKTNTGYEFSEIGFVLYVYPIGPLAAKIAFTVAFLLTLFQYSKERQTISEDPSSQGISLGLLRQTSATSTIRDDISILDGLKKNDSEHVKAFDILGAWIRLTLTKYWIVVCLAMFLVVTLQDVVIYRIIYMILFLYFLLTFQLCYRWWRLTISVFWWVTIVYSMLVLVTIYTYQFKKFPRYWNNTITDPDVLKDIGLEQFDTAALFRKLLTPLAFLIIIIVQLHYFQKDFLMLSDINRFKYVENPEAEQQSNQGEGEGQREGEGQDQTDGEGHDDSDKKDGEPKDEDTAEKALKRSLKEDVKHYSQNCLMKFSVFMDSISVLIWRLLEMHIFKLVAFTIFISCLVEVTAANVILVLLLMLAIPIPQLQHLMSHLAQIWAGLIVLARMTYQLRLVQRNVRYWLTNCTNNETQSHFPFNETNLDNAEWVGLDKLQDGNIGYYLRNYLAIVLMLAFQAVVWVHQLQYYKKPGVVKPYKGILFADTKRKDADKNLLNAIKFFINYTFYKFGLEACFIMTVVTICVRLDAFAIIYCVFLGLLLCLSRRGCYIVWPAYMIALTILLMLQYLGVLGAPPVLCWVYPWDTESTLSHNLKEWLYLPSYLIQPDAFKLLADFFQLLFVSLQWCVFYVENNQGERELNGGSDNNDISDDIKDNTNNPVEDFTSCKDSYLDYLKEFMFKYLIWFTLLIIFLTATSRISLFCMGYLIGCFVLLWMGQEMLLKPFHSLLRMWRILLAYNFFVILCKTVLQLIGCVYIQRMYDNYCWAIQLLGIACLKAHRYIENPSYECEVPGDDAGLAWDAVCFVFLIIQLRALRTYYFRHVVIDLMAQNRLASRGAELTNDRLVHRVAEQKSREEEVLQNIKDKMERIKARQAKVQSKSITDSDDHFVVIRSGDYYMFDEDSDAEDELTSKDLREGPDKDKDDKSTALDIVHSAVTEGTSEGAKKAIEQDEGGEGTSTQKEDEEEEPEKLSLWQKIKNILVIIWGVIGGILDNIIDSLNDVSKDYREIRKILEEEIKEEKERMKLEASGSQAIEEGPADEQRDPAEGVVVEIDPPEGANAITKEDETTADAVCDKEEEFTRSTPRIFQLLVALYDALISRSELLCYFAMILNVLVSASLLALPYPFSVFLWAMLCVPRPTKTYWITVITYTEAVVVVKYLFQFTFFPWNQENSILYSDSPFWAPRFIGLEKKDLYAVFDLILLFTLFIHRSVLKRNGLWKDAIDTNADLAKAEYKEATSRPSSPKTSVSEPLAIEESQESKEEDEEEDKSKKNKICDFMCGPIINFYKQMTNPKYNAVTDVYALMFFCDFICFLIVVFGYKGFGPKTTAAGGDVTTVFSENRVPIPFLVMLLAQFVLIIIDRALFLRKSIFGRFIFQIILVIVVHIWMFFILPGVTGRKFTRNVPAQMWYFFKCLYFGLAAYQIRSGYPIRILGNFLTKKYNYTNLFLFKGFLLIPFLLELRALMDWIWTDTTLGISGWLQVEDIYSNIFVLKCWREAERKYPTPRGIKKKGVIKYGVGGLLLFILIFIIWFPLVLFSFANTVYVSNNPYDVTVQIALGGYQPIFKTSAQQQFLQPINEGNYKTLYKSFLNNPVAASFFNNYKMEDIVVAQINGESTSVWGISPPSEQALIKDLRENDTAITLFFTISMTRDAKPGVTSEMVTNQFQKQLRKGSKERIGLSNIIEGGGGNNVTIEGLFPRFMRVQASGRPQFVKSLTDVIGFSNVSFSVGSNNGEKWWKLQEEVKGNDIYSWRRNKRAHLTPRLGVITFNDRVAPATLSFFSTYGIVGLYVSFILLIGNVIRHAMTGGFPMIMFTELPNVDRLLILCLDIYLVREASQLMLEEDLYAELIFLYRSPETLIRVTRRPKVKQD